MICARPGCATEFTPRTVRSKYCSRACQNNGAREETRAIARKKTCRVWWCGKQFIATNTRQETCLECLTSPVLVWSGNSVDKHDGIKELEQQQSRELRFVCVDGEGIPVECRECKCKLFVESAEPGICKCGHTDNAESDNENTGHNHRYVLLGCGDAQIENPAGLDWEEICEFLYSEFQKYDTAHTVFAGFYLNYDFTELFKTLPESKAWQLLTHEGQDKRKAQRVQHTKGKSPVPYPVKVEGKRGVWEMDMHADRRFKLRPKVCECPGDTHLNKEQRGGKACPTVPFMHVNDAGGFFQTSFLNVINPDNYEGEKPCTEDEYKIIEAGKIRRSHAKLDNDMRRYNRLENAKLSRVLILYDKGLKKAGVALRKDQWYGPGQAAQGWLDHIRAPKREEIENVTPVKVLDAARKTYIGGWFEIMAHGIIPGSSWEYDINSAYPYIIASLPCLLHGKWASKKPRTPYGGLPPVSENAKSIRLVNASVYGSNPYIGAMLHRAPDHSILRPTETRGWFWEDELQAGIRAGLIDRVECYEWHSYDPCDCSPPLQGLKGLYQGRLDVGKNSTTGKGYKLVYNSVYGKFAQSIGEPKYANAIYASRITSGCRRIIVDAIATHPDGAESVLMVATDGVYFRTPHPGLELSSALGAWECKEKRNLTLFKPGVYWDDNARDEIVKGTAPTFKARGVSAKAFSPELARIDAEFVALAGKTVWEKGDFPKVAFNLGFSMVTAKQALRRHKWGLPGGAGHVSNTRVTHTSEPSGKRAQGWLDESQGESPGYVNGIYRSRPHELLRTPEGLPQLCQPYSKEFGSRLMIENGEIDPDEYGITPDGSVESLSYMAMGVR